MRSHNFQHLMMDLDDTLLDFSSTQKRALESLFLHHNVVLTDEDYSSFRKTNQYFWQKFEQGQISKDRVKVERFHPLREKYGIEVDIFLFAEQFLKLIELHCRVLDGAIEVCEVLAQRYSLHAVTNGIGWLQKSRFEKSGLGPYFKSLTISDDCGVAKPDPHIFEMALAKTVDEYCPSQVLVIGDSLSSDIQGGINFKAKTCFYNPRRKMVSEHGADFEISDIRELIRLL